MAESTEGLGAFMPWHTLLRNRDLRNWVEASIYLLVFDRDAE